MSLIGCIEGQLLRFKACQIEIFQSVKILRVIFSRWKGCGKFPRGKKILQGMVREALAGKIGGVLNLKRVKLKYENFEGDFQLRERVWEFC